MKNKKLIIFIVIVVILIILSFVVPVRREEKEESRPATGDGWVIDSMISYTYYVYYNVWGMELEYLTDK